MSRTLIAPDTKIKVSSTLDKSVGKKNLTDGSPETCWTSQQGSPQFIQLTFADPVLPKRISLTFQGGFVGTQCSVDGQTVPAAEGEVAAPQWLSLGSIYPEDVNRKQVFEIDVPAPVKSLKLTFVESSDFFGRVTVYDLGIDGEILA